MAKANKNLIHNGFEYKKGDEIKDSAHAKDLLKMGHADADAEAKPAAGKVKKEVKPEAPSKDAKQAGPSEDAEGDDVDEENFDDLEDDMPPAPEDEPKKEDKKAPPKKSGKGKK